jgi:hypothetical protein
MNRALVFLSVYIILIRFTFSLVTSFCENYDTVEYDHAKGKVESYSKFIKISAQTAKQIK